MARMISIDRRRLPRWLQNFESRHGGPTARVQDHAVQGDLGQDDLGQDDLGQDDTVQDDAVLFRAPDGAEALVRVPFGPLATCVDDPTAALIDHVAADRLIGAILVRRGGFAVGVFDGESLISSKTGSGYVQGRTKAGGWSQQRYARRRSNQARQLYDKASGVVESILVPVLDDLVAVVGGGDRAGVIAALEPAVLTPVRHLLLPKVYPTDDPRRRVLESFPSQFLAVDIELNDLA